jgi:hypothetical protein
MSSSAAPSKIQRVEELDAHYRQRPFDLKEFEFVEFIAKVCR